MVNVGRGAFVTFNGNTGGISLSQEIDLLRICVFPGFLFIILLAISFDWVERKFMAKMQNRMGPSYTGPHGILQPFADYIKLLGKEDITPENANRLFFAVAPILAVSFFMFSIFFVPIDGRDILIINGRSGFEGDLIFSLMIVTLGTFFLFLAGWASRNPYSELGSARILNQFIGYDIPLLLLALNPAFLAGSLSIQKIAESQAIPYLFAMPWVFVLFVITLQNELEHDPFDIPDAETEIVAGFETEFSGRKLAFMRLAKDLQVEFGAALTTALFLGGPFGPTFFGPKEFWYILWFLLKTEAMVLAFQYIAAVCARLRIDQVVRGNWRLMMPLSLFVLIVTIIVRPALITLVVEG